MRFALALAVSCTAAVVAAAQTPSTGKTEKSKSITLVGCVSTDESNDDQVTFADTKDGTVYHLSGADARDFVGQRVQIVGAANPNKVHVRGGLSPSPNAAAQAGAIDPVRAAMAAQGANRGVGPAELPDFHVKGIKSVKGDCPQKKK